MSLLNAGKSRAGKWGVGIALLFLFAWPGSVAAEYKKKIAVEPLIDPSGWNGTFSPGPLIARALERSLRTTEKYQVLSLSAGKIPRQGQRHPAQVLIQGRVLTFHMSPLLKPSANGETEPQQAEVKIELVLRDSFTQKKFAGKTFSGRGSSEHIPFRVPQDEADFSAPGFIKSAIGKALTALANQVSPFVSTTLNAVPFEAVLFSVDNEKREVVINSGKNNGIRPLDVFDVFSVNKNFIDPVTQYNLGEKITRQGVIRVKTVLDDYSLAEITAGPDFEEGFVARSHYQPIPSGGQPRSWRQLYGTLIDP